MRFVVVTGPPCAGKSTHVTAHRQDGDVVIDFDALAHTLGYPTEHVVWPADDHPARRVALRARASAIRAAVDLEHTGTVWVITTEGIPAALQGQGELVVFKLDPGAVTCHARATHTDRPATTHTEIDAWYARHETTGSRDW